MFRLAHVTDLHFRSFAGAVPRDFWSKRALGALNLVVNRLREHRMELLEKLRVDLCAQRPDHLVLTGDLSNIALAGEWRAALGWIEKCGMKPESVTVIPGNHDVYTCDVVKSRAFELLFGPYQTRNLEPQNHYPFTQLRGQIAFVGVNSALPTGDWGAWGLIGSDQLARLEAVLGAAELRGITRIVLVHHPPVVHKHGERRNLRDRDAFAAVISRVGAELVLHGHDHEDQRATLIGPAGVRVPVVGAGSASYAGGHERRARYSLYEIDASAITWISRAHDKASDRFREVRREVL
jgi:3',5'-cyclic AMP phosphodiesterase CpdA